MRGGKAALLQRITSRIPSFRPAPLKESIQGASPPSVFVGRVGYPKVFVGPLVPPVSGDTSIYDAPEQWIPSGFGTENVLAYRLQLVRGKQLVSVFDQGKIVELAREIALASRPPEIEATFSSVPRGAFLHEDVQPFGPSAMLKELSVDTEAWDPKLEKAYYDTDMLAKDGMLELYGKGATASSIMRALSVGALGTKQKRKLVPTRWGITAVDSTLADFLLDKVREYPMLEEHRVYEFESFNNRYLVMLYPSLWQFEWIEAFFPSQPGDTLSIFGDWEGIEGKKEYSSVGGCYYSSKLAVLEELEKRQRQAGVLILREAYSNYIPLGVWNVRENLRHAMKQRPLNFESFTGALNHMLSRLKVPYSNWRRESFTLKNRMVQSSLQAYL